MRNFKYIWVAGLVVTLLLVILPVAFFYPRVVQSADNPWDNVPVRPPHIDHTDLMKGPYASGQEVTQACLECHEEAASEVMGTVHWTWESKPYTVAWRDDPVTVGKKNSPNNFCLGIQGNWPKCTSCHAGYGWEDDSFDFNEPTNVDCLACHADMNLYAKGDAGNPVEGLDLAAAAGNVRLPTKCHFEGGGGNGVKHGDLDDHLFNPPENVDVHMGRYDFQCIDCHQGHDHLIKGRALSVSLDDENQVYCTDCHTEKLHADERLNAHVQAVACQTCHIPAFALKDPTKIYWDWSTAGQDREEDHYTYLKIKGSFIYEKNFQPEYYWYNGVVSYRYLWGDKINPAEPTLVNPPAGDISDPNAKIWPFKVHRAKQPYDAVYDYLLQPKTAGEGGFWTEFDWDKALTLGSEIVGINYSGQYDFAETWMYWPITHMVQPKENALQCDECHGSANRLNWQALGYNGDPIEWGGRIQAAP